MEVDKNHIHLLVNYKPTMSILDIVRWFKQISTYRIWRQNGNSKILSKYFWKERTYYTDFWIEIADETKPDGKKRIFIEIKPYDQTQCPKPLTESATLKEHKAYNRAAQTFLVNQSKWTAAREFFKSRGAEFMVITERTLQQLGLL